jgi:hypothetical protein
MASYTARVEWGDGSLIEDVGVWRTDEQSFAIHGSHTFREPGSYTATLYLRDDDSPDSSYTTSVSITVNDAGPLTLLGETLAATEGQLVSTSSAPSAVVEASTDPATRKAREHLARLATFSDPDLERLPADYQATVNWGMARPKTPW